MKEFIKKYFNIEIFEENISPKFYELRRYIKENNLSVYPKEYNKKSLGKFIEKIHSIKLAYAILLQEVDYTYEVNNMPDELARFVNLLYNERDNIKIPYVDTKIFNNKLVKLCSIEFLKEYVMGDKKILKEFPFIMEDDNVIIEENIETFILIYKEGKLKEFIKELTKISE